MWGGLILMAYFGVVFVIDMEHKLILRQTNVAGVLICGYLGWRMHGVQATLLGGAAGFGIMLVLYYFGVLFTRALSRRREESVDEVALGFGDVSLSLILGLLLGWPGITAGLFFAVLAGGLGSGIYLLVNKLTKGYEDFTAIPYAPFLLFGAVVLIFVLPPAP
jgi:leader peptidase (prepilin peptidase)/N-methyltransferase